MTTRANMLSWVPLAGLVAGLLASPPCARADNKRRNSGVFINVYTAQRQNSCQTEPRLDDRLVDAARRHTLDVLNNPDIEGDIGSDGSKRSSVFCSTSG